MLVDFKSVGLDYPTVSLVSTRSFIKKDPDTVRRFLMAYSEGVERLYRDKELAMKVMGKYTKTSPTARRWPSAYSFCDDVRRAPAAACPYKAVETVLAQIGREGAEGERASRPRTSSIATFLQRAGEERILQIRGALIQEHSTQPVTILDSHLALLD
jgi:ABC-type nitrate/sulfonate/bicarbonate transport system substrate-binding protein